MSTIADRSSSAAAIAPLSFTAAGQGSPLGDTAIIACPRRAAVPSTGRPGYHARVSLDALIRCHAHAHVGPARPHTMPAAGGFGDGRPAGRPSSEPAVEARR